MVAWAATVAVAWRLGEHHRIPWKLRAAPLAGFFDRHVTVATFVVLALGIGLARVLPGWAQRTRWRRLLGASGLLAVGWGSALASTRGLGGLDRGISSRLDYSAVIPAVDRIGVHRFIQTFSHHDVLSRYPIHVQGHPVGTPLFFVALDRIGLGRPGVAAVVVLLLSSAGCAAVLVTVRELAGEAPARRAAPFLILAPALVWWVTSADALFLAVEAWGIAALVLSTATDHRRRSVALAVASGAALGLGLFLSYGLAPVALVGAVPVVRRRRWSSVGWAAVGGAAVFAAFAVAGFWWPAGLATTGRRYWAGVASVRPYAYFATVGNLAALSIALGPASWVAVARVRSGALWRISGAALAGVAVANATGLSKAEVERIWLPFVPWILVLCAGLAEPAFLLLSLQVFVGVAVETLVKTPW